MKRLLAALLLAWHISYFPTLESAVDFMNNREQNILLHSMTTQYVVPIAPTMLKGPSYAVVYWQ